MLFVWLLSGALVSLFMRNESDESIRQSDSISSLDASADSIDATRFEDRSPPGCKLDGSVDNRKSSSSDDQRAVFLKILERVSDSRYQIFEEIGRGGMGIVFRAKDKRLQRDVAMKVISPSRIYDSSFIDRFIEEAQISGQLQHPSIVPVYDIGKLDSGHLFFTMKLVRGETLASLLLKRTAPSDALDHWLGIFYQLCQAVAFAHSKQVIHRDLKPANVMVGRFGEVNVMDWGLAKLQTANSNNRFREDIATSLTELSSTDVAEGASEDIHSVQPVNKRTVSDDANGIESTKHDFYSVVQTIRHGVDVESESSPMVSSELVDLTQIGVVLGTVAYMPPEQASGQNDKVDFRSDVFSLGAILCEIVTGVPPYIPNDNVDLLQMAIEGAVEPALLRIEDSQAHPDIQELVRSCLAPMPAHRPSNAGLLTKRLEEIISHSKERMRKAEQENAATVARLEEAARTYVSERRSQRMILLASILSLSLLFALIGGSILLSHRESIKVSQNMLTLEQFSGPATILTDGIWDARVMPASTEFTRLVVMKEDLELAISRMDIGPIVIQSASRILQRISQLENSRSFVLNLDKVYWEYNPFAGVYDPEKLLEGAVSNHDRNVSLNHQLQAYQRLFQEMLWNSSTVNGLGSLDLKSMPRWALDEIDVGLMRFNHLCRDYLNRYGQSLEIERLLQRIDSDLSSIRNDQGKDKQLLLHDLWQAVFERNVPLMMKLAEDPRVDELSVPARQTLARALLEYGPEYHSEVLQTQIEWLLIESKDATEKPRARRIKDGSVIAFEIIANLKNDDVLAVRLDTFHDFESGIGPGERDGQLPDDENRCLLDEVAFTRQSSDGNEFTDLEITHVVSGHLLVPGREITNAVDYTSGTFWSLAHRPEQSVATSYFFVRPIRTARYPILRIRVDNGHPEYRQMTSLGKYRIYYANSVPELKDPILAADQLIQRLSSESILTPRVQMLVAEIASMASYSDLNTAVSTASLAYRLSPGDSGMAELFLRLVTRLSLDSQNSWLTKIHRNLETQAGSSDSEQIRRKLSAHYSRLGDEFFEIWHQGSLVMYEQSLSTDAKVFKRYGRLGERLRKIGKVDEAQAVMEKGIELAAEVSENWYYLGSMVYDYGNYHRCVALLQQSLIIEPNDLRSRRTLCRALFKSKLLTEGFEQFEFLRSYDQVDDYTLSLAVSTCLLAKDVDRALQLIEWWGKQDGKIVDLKTDSMLSSYYDSHSAAWYYICLAAMDEAIPESRGHESKDDNEHLDLADTRMLSIFDMMSSDHRLDWETIFAMIDRALYGRGVIEPLETLDNLQRLLIALEKRYANTNRIRIRLAAICLKSGQEERARGVIKNLPANTTNPYSAFGDIIKRVLDENSGADLHLEQFIFPSDRTQLLPERDRDLAEWLWWDRNVP
jgi:serine/threonine protein kinase/tetratricopeptide (TPR) repeat protein